MLCLHLCISATCISSALRSHKRTSGLLELEFYKCLWTTMWVQGIEPRSPGRHIREGDSVHACSSCSCWCTFTLGDSRLIQSQTLGRQEMIESVWCFIEREMQFEDSVWPCNLRIRRVRITPLVQGFGRGCKKSLVIGCTASLISQLLPPYPTPGFYY